MTTERTIQSISMLIARRL